MSPKPLSKKQLEAKFKKFLLSHQATYNAKFNDYEVETSLGLLYVSLDTDGSVWSINSRFKELVLEDFLETFGTYEGLNKFSHKWNLLAFKDKSDMMLNEFQKRLNRIKINKNVSI